MCAGGLPPKALIVKKAHRIPLYAPLGKSSQELRYKGNQFLREFVGCQTEDGKDCPYCGQKHHAG